MNPVVENGIRKDCIDHTYVLYMLNIYQLDKKNVLHLAPGAMPFFTTG